MTETNITDWMMTKAVLTDPEALAFMEACNKFQEHYEIKQIKIMVIED